jgi:hypothetical protein
MRRAVTIGTHDVMQPQRAPGNIQNPATHICVAVVHYVAALESPAPPENAHEPLATRAA